MRECRDSTANAPHAPIARRWMSPTGGAIWRRAIRPTASRGPCGDERPGWRDRPGCASAAGSRGSSRGDGCSAGKYACSRVGSRLDGAPRGRFNTHGWPARGARAREIAVAWQADRRTLRVNHRRGQTGALPARRPGRPPARLSTYPHAGFPPPPPCPQYVHAATTRLWTTSCTQVCTWLLSASSGPPPGCGHPVDLLWMPWGRSPGSTLWTGGADRHTGSARCG